MHNLSRVEVAHAFGDLAGDGDDAVGAEAVLPHVQ